MGDIVTAQQIRSSAKAAVNESNMNSVVVAVNRFGASAGLDRPHRLAQFICQVMHESGDFRYDREIWGPTPAQEKYDTRTDLGNTPAADGDGKKYMGRTAMQITGRANYQALHDWCAYKGFNPPDFLENPDLVNTDPWEGLACIWFWDSHGLNKFADAGDIEAVTKHINGGFNGLADRIDHYARFSLVLLGYGAGEIKRFQAGACLTADGVVGPKTCAALHAALVALR